MQGIAWMAAAVAIAAACGGQVQPSADDPNVCTHDAPSVSCGNQSCGGDTPYCCANNHSCVNDATAGTCKGFDTPADILRCDDASDCPQGQVCCSTPGAVWESWTCQASCGTHPQLCEKSCECVGGKQCVGRFCQ